MNWNCVSVEDMINHLNRYFMNNDLITFEDESGQMYSVKYMESNVDGEGGCEIVLEKCDDY
jgi:hypothetical protein